MIAHGTQAHWDQVYRRAAETGSEAAQRVIASIVALVDAETKNMGGVVRIADLGTGRGGLCRELSRPGRLVLGLDISPATLAAASREGWSAVATDARQLALADGAVQLVTCARALWTFPNPPRCLAEISRVLCCGGRAVIQLWDEPTNCRLLSLGAAIIGRVSPDLQRPAGIPGPFDITPALLAQAAAPYGLDCERVETHHLRQPLAGLTDYWREFAGLAETAHHHLRGLDPAMSATVNRALLRLLDIHYRNDGGGYALPLRWRICILRKTS